MGAPSVVADFQMRIPEIFLNVDDFSSEKQDVQDSSSTSRVSESDFSLSTHGRASSIRFGGIRIWRQKVRRD
jgi:hypothetical protein